MADTGNELASDRASEGNAVTVDNLMMDEELPVKAPMLTQTINGASTTAQDERRSSPTIA